MVDSNLEIVKELLYNVRVALLTFKKGDYLWSVPLYFVFLENTIFFFSSKKSLHASVVNRNVAVSIFQDSKNLREIKGIQGSGELFEVKDVFLSTNVTMFYLKKYPEVREILFRGGILNNVSLYGIKLERAILTKNDPYFFYKTDIIQILSKLALK